MPATLFSKKAILLSSIISAIYLLLSALLVGYKQDQLVLVALFLVCYFASFITRKFITGFAIFAVYWILFDYMKALPNFTFNNVSIAELYEFEKRWFGISVNGQVLIPNVYFAQFHYQWLDFLTGFFYLCWVPVPLAFAAYLFFQRRTYFLQFSLSFLLVNLIGFVIYYIYPAAPPWYVMQNGFTFIEATKGSCAGLIRFDEIVGSPVFQSLYSKGSNVFAAMPSLHAAYPVIVLYYGIKCKMGWINSLLVVLVLGIWFSAIYNAHHYITDVLAGAICAAVSLLIFERFLLNNRLFNQFYQKYYSLIK